MLNGPKLCGQRQKCLHRYNVLRSTPYGDGFSSDLHVKWLLGSRLSYSEMPRFNNEGSKDVVTKNGRYERFAFTNSLAPSCQVLASNAWMRRYRVCPAYDLSPIRKRSFVSTSHCSDRSFINTMILEQPYPLRRTDIQKPAENQNIYKRAAANLSAVVEFHHN
jgi:hypothetical protein